MSESWVVDRGIGKLIDQYVEASDVPRSEVGTIGDENHSPESKHSPEDTEDSQDGNDPDNQVDAADFPHDPSRNSDMAVFTEALRKSKDKRLWLVIFNGRQFSSYAKDGYAPYTWRPYTGPNKHTGHGHVEVNDYHNDVTTPWQIGIDMGLSSEEYSEIVKGKLTDDNALYYWIRALALGKVPSVVNGKFDWNNMVDADFPGLEQIGEALTVLSGRLTALEDAVETLSIPAPAPVDPAALRAVVLDPAVLSAQANAVNDDFHQRLEN